MKILGVIPARYNSSRLPGKPLFDICGKPMIWWVYQEAIKSDLLSDVVIATDDNRIKSICEKYEMNVIMTSENHDTPTSRLTEVADAIDADYYLTIMGDEPLVNKESFELVIPKEDVCEFYVAALTNILEKPADVIDFSNQKVVTNCNREALIISRSPIPYPKGTLDVVYEKVTGIQLFSKKSLEFFKATSKSKLEVAEENDLLRFIENGVKVNMVVSKYETISVDTQKDLDLVINILNQRNK